MSIAPTNTTPVDTAFMPADIRKAGPKAEQMYATALEFERVLVQQLTKELNATTQPDGSDDSDDTASSDSASSDAATSTVQQMIPDAFAQSLAANGGIGVARQLYQALQASEGTAAK